MPESEQIRFFLEQRGKVTGPFTDDDVRDSVRDGTLEEGARVRLAGSDLWASPRAWATLSIRRSLVPAPDGPAEAESKGVPEDLAKASDGVLSMLLFFVHDRKRTFGPYTGEQLKKEREAGKLEKALVALVDSREWAPLTALLREKKAEEEEAPPITARTGAAAASAPPLASLGTTRCAACLEKIPISASECPECGEATSPSSTQSAAPPSIPDVAPNATWFAMHWRPLLVIGTVAGLLSTGLVLRSLAPSLMSPIAGHVEKTAKAAAPAPACPTACWNGEACVNAHCVWQKPNDVGHVAADAEPIVGGQWALPKDVSDALPLDSERFAVALLTGIRIHNARTGEVLGIVTDAPQARRLYRVGPVLYATAPQRIYVVDAQTTRTLKAIEVGAPVGEVVVGASGRRALASLPTAHAVAVIATEYNAEIDRIQFGDDSVGPIGVDDTGTRALTTTGIVPLAGLRDPQGGAAYAFDPSRLASAQDRVRSSLVGNPVSVLMTPAGTESYVALRAEDKLVPLEWLPSGGVRRLEPIATCREPEQVVLGRKERRAIVRCNEGRALEIVDLGKHEVIRRVPLNARATDLAVSPDGEQAVVALPGENNGFVGLVDLKTFAVRLVPLDAEPTRVRLAPDGRTALVLSDRAKVAWVIR